MRDEIIVIPLTGVDLIGYHFDCKAMLLMAAITEATPFEPADVFTAIDPGPAKTFHRVRNNVKEVNHHGR